MSITCKAAVIRDNSLSEPYEISKPLSIEDIKISPPLENEILVKVMGAGLCHSDITHYMKFKSITTTNSLITVLFNINIIARTI